MFGSSSQAELGDGVMGLVTMPLQYDVSSSNDNQRNLLYIQGTYGCQTTEGSPAIAGDADVELGKCKQQENKTAC
jgi:hypothetical protein